MNVSKKLVEPVEITEEILNKCTCEIYNWSANPCPYYANQPDHENAKCNCCPHCLKKCSDSANKK